MRIIAPTVPNKSLRRPAFLHPLKNIGKTFAGDMVVVDDLRRAGISNMILWPGYILPAKGNLPLIEGLEEVIIKASPYESRDADLVCDRDILLALNSMCSTPNVLGFGNVLTEDAKEQRETPYFVMPKIAGKDLYDYIIMGWERKPSRPRVDVLCQKILPALAESLAELHLRGFVHRDVKPNNALYTAEAETLTLLDFGRANWLKAANPRRDVGAFGFYPPEIKIGEESSEDVRTDVYGFGTTCANLLTGAGGVVYKGMQNPWGFGGLDFMFLNRSLMYRKYEHAINEHREFSVDELVVRSNLPDEFKSSLTSIEEIEAELSGMEESQ